MKTSTLLAALFISISSVAIAQTSDAAREVGPLLDHMNEQAAQRCQAAREELKTGAPGATMRLERRMDCECSAQSLAAAFPENTRSTRVTKDVYTTRSLAAQRVCMARLVRAQSDDDCARGADPFARSTAGVPKALTAGRCSCMHKELSKVADLDLAAAADKAMLGDEPDQVKAKRARDDYVFLSQAQELCKGAASAK